MWEVILVCRASHDVLLRLSVLPAIIPIPFLYRFRNQLLGLTQKNNEYIYLINNTVNGFMISIAMQRKEKNFQGKKIDSKMNHCII